MKISCGTDIIEISRIKQSIESHEESFKSNIFTENEVKYCESHKNQKYQHYAARFAAKEAIFKALSKKINSELIWINFEIINRIEEFKVFGCPILLGLSRKSLLNMPDADNDTKDIFTVALNTLAVEKKVDIIRVHNVRLHRMLIDMLDNV